MQALAEQEPFEPRGIDPASDLAVGCEKTLPRDRQQFLRAPAVHRHPEPALGACQPSLRDIASSDPLQHKLALSLAIAIVRRQSHGEACDLDAEQRRADLERIL